MVGLLLLAVLSLLSSCYSALVKCNGTALKIQLCNIDKEEYDENLPPGSIGNPLTIKPSIILEKIAKVDDKANHIKRLYYIVIGSVLLSQIEPILMGLIK